jgi:myosin regulatory light chain 12
LTPGALHEDYLRDLLTTMGDRFSHEEVDEMYKEAPIKNGMFDFVEFTRYASAKSVNFFRTQ